MYSFEARDQLPWDDSPPDFFILSPTKEVICIVSGCAQDAARLCALLNAPFLAKKATEQGRSAI